MPRRCFAKRQRPRIKSRVENILENETDLATTAISESAHPRASHALTAGVRVFGVSHCHIDGTMMGQKKCPCLLALSHLSHCLIIFQKGVNRKKHAPQKRGGVECAPGAGQFEVSDLTR